MDPMERLTAADPLTEPERLTEADQREADLLLARILAEEPEPASRPRRRWVPVVAATAAAIVLALVVFDLLDEEAPGPNVVERAVAAVSAGNSIYHTVQVVTYADQRSYVEAWHGPRVSRQKVYDLADGRRGKLLIEEVMRPWPKSGPHSAGTATIYEAEHNIVHRLRLGRESNPTFPEFDPSEDPAAGLRELERQGRLHLAGREEFEGREVYRLVGDARDSADRVNRLVYLVDADSYYPVFMEWVFGPHGSARVRTEWRFTTYERLPANAENRELLRMDPHPGARLDRNRDGRADATGGSGGR